MIKKSIARVVVTLSIALGIVVATNSPALASGSFENNQTTMIIRDNGVYVGTVEVAIWTMNRPRQQVKARVFAAGFSGWTKVESVSSFTT